MPIHIILTSKEGGVLDANPAACRIFGMTKEELLLRNRNCLLDGGDPGVISFLATRATTGKATGEVMGIRLDGSRVPLEASSAVFSNHAGQERICVIFRDVQARKDMESRLIQSQKMEALGLLAGGIAHDFNNLLSAIHFYGNLISDNPYEHVPVHNFAQLILEVTQRGVELTRGLLTFSRQDGSKHIPVSPNSVVNNIAAMLKRVLPRTITLTTSLCPDCPPFKGNLGKIEQVLMNLVMNARDAMPEGGNPHSDSRRNGRPGR